MVSTRKTKRVEARAPTVEQTKGSAAVPEGHQPRSHEGDMSALIQQMMAASKNSQREPMEAFDGQGDIDRCLRAYEDLGRRSGWNERKISQNLEFHLKDMALDWFEAQSYNEDLSGTEWPELELKVLEVFRPSSNQASLKGALYRRQ